MLAVFIMRICAAEAERRMAFGVSVTNESTAQLVSSPKALGSRTAPGVPLKQQAKKTGFRIGKSNFRSHRDE